MIKRKQRPGLPKRRRGREKVMKKVHQSAQRDAVGVIKVRDNRGEREKGGSKEQGVLEVISNDGVLFEHLQTFMSTYRERDIGDNNNVLVYMKVQSCE